MSTGLSPKLAKIAKNLPKVAKSLGFDARVTSGYRSHAKQKKLYDLYKAGLHPYPVAYPGTSDHEYGLAIDVVSSNLDALVALLTEAGLFWAGPTDNVHFSMLDRRKPGGLIVGTYPVSAGESRKLAVPSKAEWDALTRQGKWGKLDKKINLGFLNALFRGLFPTSSTQ